RRLHAFPTRRSSDLTLAAILFFCVCGWRGALIPVVVLPVLPAVGVAESTLVASGAATGVLLGAVAHRSLSYARRSWDALGEAAIDRKSTRLNSSHVK